MIGYDFSIQYKKEKDNLVTNALLHMVEVEGNDEGMFAMISFPTTKWLEELKSTYDGSPELSKIEEELLVNQQGSSPYKL